MNPDLTRRLAQARLISERYWERSWNFDQVAEAEILPRDQLKALEIPWGTDGTDPARSFVSAGVFHTYGYWVSQLQTPYGLKSRRWKVSRLDEKLGLAPRMFSPAPPQGEFLDNLTRALRAALPLARSRVERVRWQVPGGVRDAEIWTYLYRFPRQLSVHDPEVALLIYGVRWGKRGLLKLVTAFPVSAQAEGELAAEGALGPHRSSQMFKPRYNLYIPSDWKLIRAERSAWRQALSQPPKLQH